MVCFRGAHFEAGIIRVCARWYLAYPLSYRHIAEIMKERGIELDPSTLPRWVLKYTPQLKREFRKHKGSVGKSWRVDQTYRYCFENLFTPLAEWPAVRLDTPSFPPVARAVA